MENIHATDKTTIHAVFFSSLVALSGPSFPFQGVAPHCEEGCPSFFIGLPFIRRKKVGFHLSCPSYGGQKLGFTWVAKTQLMPVCKLNNSPWNAHECVHLLPLQFISLMVMVQKITSRHLVLDIPKQRHFQPYMLYYILIVLSARITKILTN